MRDLRPEDFPGFAEAVAAEQVQRDAAFLPITETLCGIEVQQLTLRRWLLLRLMRSPLVVGGTPSPQDLGAFLWVISTAYNPAGRGRARFLRKFRRRYLSDVWSSAFMRSRSKKVILAAILLQECRRYLADTFMDMMGGPAGAGFQTSYYSDAAWICGAICGAGLANSDEAVLEMPIRRILQYLRDLAKQNGTPIGNRSDKIVNDALAAAETPEKN